MPQIIAPVGRGGTNRREDVIVVQRLLNGRISTSSAVLKEDGICGEKTIGAISEFQRRILGKNPPDGRVDPHGTTFRSLAGEGGSLASGPGHLYTGNPNERVTTSTKPNIPELVNALRASWPELTANGARTLAAQCMGETGGGRHCYNWNLGNVKSGPDHPHMYLHNVWELLSSTAAQGVVEHSGGLASIASEGDDRKHGWAHAAGQSVVVFQPPSSACRFRAYFSLQEGAQQWCQRYKGMAARDPKFLTALNAGDTAAVAHMLKHARYYTGLEESYAKNMASNKAKIDQQLGPAV